MEAARDVLEALLAPHLGDAARAWLARATAELAAVAPGAGARRTSELLALAARQVSPRRALDPDALGRARAEGVQPGWNPERWSACDALRAALLLARRDLATPAGAEVLEGLFAGADEGELVALYRALPLVPDPGRCVWRMGEGCRSNMRTVFEAAACDTPFACTWFDPVGWRALVIKAVFVGAPLWRVWGLDRRLDADIAAAALDLVDERRAAGRPVPPELWLCLGAHGGARAVAAARAELADAAPMARLGGGLALARAGAPGAHGELARHLEREPERRVAAALEAALAGRHGADVWRAFESELRPAR